MPWGAGGCLWRSLLFLLALLLFIFLLSLFRGCDTESDSSSSKTEIPLEEQYPLLNPENPREKYDPTDPIDVGGKDNPEEDPFEPRHDDGRAIVPELPDDKDNRVPPIEDDEVEPDPNGRQFINDRLNVLLHRSSEEEMARWAQEFKRIYPGAGYQIVYYNPNTGFMQITVPKNDRERVKAEINGKMPDFDFIVFDESLFGGKVKTNDPAYGYSKISWWQDELQLFDAWDITMGSEDIIVGIVDSYFDLRHDEFKGKKIVKPYSIPRRNNNVAPEPGTAEPELSHGSHVSCLAVGNADNKRGASGIAPKCSLMPISVCAPNAAGISSLDFMQGILYCIFNDCAVVNISIGSAFDESTQHIPVADQIRIAQSSYLEEEHVWDYVFKTAEKHRCTIVWSCGNENVLAGLDESKRNANTIRVSALDRTFNKADFSNYGLDKNAKINYSTVSAPGVDICSAIAGNSYDLWPGTSMAAPIVTGTVALMKSIDRSLSTKQVIEILLKTGKRLPEEQRVGPMIQIKDALVAVRDGLMDYDDVINDPKSIIGLWESTTPLYNNSDEEVKIYMRFDSETRGELIIVEPDGTEFKAPLAVAITDSEIKIGQRRNATSPNSDTEYRVYKYRCSPDEEGKLVCVASSEKGDQVDFNLRKIE